MTYHDNNTYAKLAPESILNKKIKEIMRYTGDTGHPLFRQRFKLFLQVQGGYTVMLLLTNCSFHAENNRTLVFCTDPNSFWILFGCVFVKFGKISSSIQ